jgi:O-antigen ligase
MPETLKALFVVLVIATAVFVLFSKPMVLFGVDKDRITVRAKAYLFCLIGMFLTGDFWIASIVLLLAMHWASKTETNPLALYLMFILGLPNPNAFVSGLGVFGHLIEVTPHRYAAALILLPEAFKIYKRKQCLKAPLAVPQKFHLCYLFLLFFLTLDAGTFLGVVRGAVLYPIFDALLIIYVAANTMHERKRLWDFLATFVFMILVVAAIAVFEANRHWLLFSTASHSLLSYMSTGTAYLLRDDSLLRAMGPAAHPIVLGYLIMIALLVVLGSLGRASFSATFLILGILIAGSVATVSRGPWVGIGCGVLVLCIVSCYRKMILLCTSATILCLVLLALFTERGKVIVSFLPFFGTVETGSIDYRERLVEIAFNVASQNPFFGAYDFLLRPEMEEMRQGQGIIDIVNTYVAVVLFSGLTGLFFFVGSFASALYCSLKSVNGRGNKYDEMAIASQIVAACIVAILVTIYTVSSIGTIPNTYWAFIGVSVACYTSFLTKKRSDF